MRKYFNYLRSLEIYLSSINCPESENIVAIFHSMIQRSRTSRKNFEFPKAILPKKEDKKI